MKTQVLLVSCILIFKSLTAQEKIERFFDYNWKQCDPDKVVPTYYSLKVIEDSLWHQKDYYIKEKHLQMEGYYTDTTERVKQGLVTYFYPNGMIKEKSFFNNNIKQGICLKYHSNGMISDSSFYINGVIAGISATWYNDGNVSTELTMDTLGMGTGVYVGYFENEKVFGKGRYSAGMKENGIWNFYYQSGAKSADVIYDKGTIVSSKCYTEDGVQQSECDIRLKAPEFPGGEDALKKFIQKNTYWPGGYQFTKDAKAQVVVGFVVDVDGSVTDVNVLLGFHEAFDRIAVKAIKSLPKFKPATQYNRKIRYRYRQTVAFEQTEQ